MSRMTSFWVTETETAFEYFPVLWSSGTMILILSGMVYFLRFCGLILADVWCDKKSHLGEMFWALIGDLFWAPHNKVGKAEINHLSEIKVPFIP